MDEEQNLTNPVMPPTQPASNLTPTPSFPATPIPPAGYNQTTNLSNNKGMALLAYLGILIIVPFLSEAKNDSFVKFHLKQGLVLIIAYIGTGIVSSMFSYVLYAIGGLSFMLSFLFPVLYLGLFIINIIGIINAVNNRTQELPIIGGFASMFTF